MKMVETPKSEKRKDPQSGKKDRSSSAKKKSKPDAQKVRACSHLEIHNIIGANSVIHDDVEAIAPCKGSVQFPAKQL